MPLLFDLPDSLLVACSRIGGFGLGGLLLVNIVVGCYRVARAKPVDGTVTRVGDADPERT